MIDRPAATARPELPKRFYKIVGISETGQGYAVELDGRSIKTPARKLMSVPRRDLAEAVAAEWEAQGERIDPATMPTTRLVNTVIDAIAPDMDPVRSDLIRFAETDLLFYRAAEPERLADRQRHGWDPVIAFAEERLATRFNLTEGVMHVAQPAEAVAAYGRWVEAIDDPFALAGLHQATTLTGSALIAMALAEGHLPVEEAWRLSLIDEDWNIEQWGEDAEAMALRARRFEEMRVAGLLLARG